MPLEDVLGATLLALTVDFAEPVQIKDVIGTKRTVDEQLPAPMPIGMLLP